MDCEYHIVQTVIFLCLEAAFSLEPFPREPPENLVEWIEIEMGISIDIHKKGKSDY